MINYIRNTIYLLLTLISLSSFGQLKSTGNFNEGYSRLSYISVKGCKIEFQCFDSTISEKDLQLSLSFFYRIGAKNRGVEQEFKTYRSFDFSGKSVTKKQITNFSSNQMKLFNKSVKDLKNKEVPIEFNELKLELIKINSQKLRFEKIFDSWYKTNNDKEFKKQILEYYSDPYVIATLEKTLSIKNYNDKLKYSHAELYDLFNSKVFPIDGLIELQNKLMHKYQIEIVIEENCTKS